MLEPREADIPVLFLFFVVLPIVAYILLGKWNEVSKKNARISMLAQLAAIEACSIEQMETVDAFQPITTQNTAMHYCARCFSPATTRCSRCKSIRYCSGKCQIIHWRQGHKQECQQWETLKKLPSVAADDSTYQNEFADMNMKTTLSQNGTKDLSHNFRVIERRRPREEDTQAKRQISKLEDDVGKCLDEYINPNAMCDAVGSATIMPDDALTRHKLGEEFCTTSMSVQNKQINSYHMPIQTGNIIESSSEVVALHSVKESDASSGALGGKGEIMFKKPPYMIESNSSSQKTATKSSRTRPANPIDRIYPEKESRFLRPENNGNHNPGERDHTKKFLIPSKRGTSGFVVDNTVKNKLLFPFEDLVILFQSDIFDISPRGLVNCGNSCYANAVLQCLSCTKPLLVYLLQEIHSKSCCVKGWCLMCELELHVTLLREGGGPLSPTRILSNMTNSGCFIGGGNQEDAHEFLRLLVMSMQSICLEGLGGEKRVDPRLQDTTLIQQIFGGRLRSMVKCLRCELESERYENIMDLTLEIHGWVESLEDALTQFTAAEDLDGDNMYRCERCSAYVMARKQLQIHEAPNILTIVLKRFQTGRYGKINKCVTFPDILDMIPYMTGTGDSPPLYMLYAVVVHLDMCNASFSGHYISYVKDLQGTWFRIDDTEIEPVHLSHVMSEGAYMLFYSRSSPRPPRIQSYKCATKTTASSLKASMVKPPKSSRQEASKLSERVCNVPKGVAKSVRLEATPFLNDQEAISRNKNYSKCSSGLKGNCFGAESADFSDTSYSTDRSIFTNSDECSFTTESMSDSFSNVDHSDAANLDPILSLFSPMYMPEYSDKSISCRKLSNCRPHTEFYSESRGLVFDSRTSTIPSAAVHKGRDLDCLAAGSRGKSLC